MSDFKVKYDKKGKVVTVECDNVFEDIRKSGKDVLLLNPLQAYVEVPVDIELTNAKGVEEAVETKAQTAADVIIAEVKELVTELRKLKEDEKKGDKKAATLADKAVKQTEKSVKKWAGEFGAKIRKVVQEEYIEQTKGKTQLRSTGRTLFRGMELNEDAFEGSAEEDSKEAAESMGSPAKKLSVAGKEVAGLAKLEKDSRNDLKNEVQRVFDAIEKDRAGKQGFDIQDYAKRNPKDAKAVESQVDSYLALLDKFVDALGTGHKQFLEIQKIVEKSEKLQEDKDIAKGLKEFEGAEEIVEEMLNKYKETGDEAQKLFKQNYGKGEFWKGVISSLAALKGCTNSASLMQDRAGLLAKVAKG